MTLDLIDDLTGLRDREQVQAHLTAGTCPLERQALLCLHRDDDGEAAYLPALEAAGYVLRVREPGHRVVVATPPLPSANVHVHVPGDSQLDARLRLRDRLRADPAARRRYEDVKRSLAGRVWPDANHDAEAKGDVIAELLA